MNPVTENRKNGTDLGDRLFEPRFVLPEQFYESVAGKGAMEGEKRLLAAVLEDAVGCFMKEHPTTGRRQSVLFREAEAWIFNEEEGWFFSFRNACDILGLDPDFIRAGLLRWVESRSLREAG